MSPSPLRLYGVPFSQPVRAVLWLLLLEEIPFELVPINPGSKGENGSRHPDFLAKNPAGTIPTIEEPDSGFTLGEAHAIMPYLCRRHERTARYPDDLQARARVDAYLHYHHRNVRDASGLVAPKIRKDLNIPEAMQEAARRTITRALSTLDGGWLATSRFIEGDTVTVADLAAYAEIGQLQPEFTNLFDFGPYANVQRWLADMHEVPHHDDVHLVLAQLGDISEEAPAMEAIRDANIASIRRVHEVLAQRG
ncbi:MAG: glutathione S-transferase family protein [Acidobacteriota bacterium]